jgi:hypothetical protein
MDCSTDQIISNCPQAVGTESQENYQDNLPALTLAVEGATERLNSIDFTAYSLESIWLGERSITRIPVLLMRADLPGTL